MYRSPLLVEDFPDERRLVWQRYCKIFQASSPISKQKERIKRSCDSLVSNGANTRGRTGVKCSARSQAQILVEIAITRNQITIEFLASRNDNSSNRKLKARSPDQKLFA